MGYLIYALPFDYNTTARLATTPRVPIAKVTASQGSLGSTLGRSLNSHSNGWIRQPPTKSRRG